jgi:hypothetical protein
MIDLMNKSTFRKCTAVCVLVIALVGGSTPAEASTKIVFPKGSYCGSYSGNYKNGRQFRLGLKANQRFVVRNTGVGQQTNWSVVGPTGEIEAHRVDQATLEYFTEATGWHYVNITSTASRSSMQFCAY